MEADAAEGQYRVVIVIPLSWSCGTLASVLVNYRFLPSRSTRCMIPDTEQGPLLFTGQRIILPPE